MGTYEFGANVINERFMMLGRITSDARLSGRVMANVRDWMTAKVQCQLSQEPGQSQVMMDTDLKGKDWQAQIKMGNPGFYGARPLTHSSDRLHPLIFESFLGQLLQMRLMSFNCPIFSHVSRLQNV